MPAATTTDGGGSSLWGKLAGWSLVLLLGLGAFGIALVAAMPVQIAVSFVGKAVPLTNLSGTVLQGQGQLDGGHVVQWDAAGRDSWLTFALVYDVRITGPQTVLAGRVALRPARAVIGPLSGTAAWPLVAAILPAAQIACDSVAEVRIGSIILTPQSRKGIGHVTVPAGFCDRLDGTVTRVPVPDLQADIATVEDGIETVVTSDATVLVTARITNDNRAKITIHAEGAAMVPGMPSSADSQLDIPLGLLR